MNEHEPALPAEASDRGAHGAGDSATEARRRSRVRTMLDADQTIVKLDATADRLNETLDTFGALLVDFTAALESFNTSIRGFDGTVDQFQGVVEKADGLLGRADVILGPLAATQQVGDQLRSAGQLAGQVASAAVRKGVAAGKGVTAKGFPARD